MEEYNQNPAWGAAWHVQSVIGGRQVKENIVIENNFPSPVEPSSGVVVNLMTRGISTLNVEEALRGRRDLGFSRVVVWGLEVRGAGLFHHDYFRLREEHVVMQVVNEEKG